MGHGLSPEQWDIFAYVQSPREDTRFVNVGTERRSLLRDQCSVQCQGSKTDETGSCEKKAKASC